MRTFARRSVPALLLAVLLLSTAAPLAATPAAGEGSAQVLLGSLVEQIFHSVAELLHLGVHFREKCEEPYPAAETTGDGPTGQAELGGSIDPDG